MKTHVGVDLHQRLCYLTAVDASGKTFKQGQVVVEASGFWPAFARAVAPELERPVKVFEPDAIPGLRSETWGTPARPESRVLLLERLAREVIERKREQQEGYNRHARVIEEGVREVEDVAFAYGGLVAFERY